MGAQPKCSNQVLTVSRKQDEPQPPLRRRADGGRSNAKHHARTTVSSCGGSTAAFHLLGAPPERTGRPAISQRAAAAAVSGRPDEERPAEVAAAFTCRGSLPT